jgi:hypothetical protein
MEQVRRYWHPDRGWVSLDDRALPPGLRQGGGWPVGSRGDGLPPPAAPRPVGATDAPPSAPVAEVAAVPERGARMAALRRAIVLSEIIGPPRALRRDGGF